MSYNCNFNNSYLKSCNKCYCESSSPLCEKSSMKNVKNNIRNSLNDVECFLCNITYFLKCKKLYHIIKK